jgi:hypothetical protein
VSCPRQAGDGAALILAGAVEDEARMREDEIDRAGVHRWDVVVLWEY